MSSVTQRLPDSLQSARDLAFSNLHKAYTQLPEPTQSYLESAAKFAYLDQIPLTALAGSLLVLLLATVSMSRWGPNLWGSGQPARFSPFTRSAYPPEVNDTDFSYITSADLAEPRRAYDPNLRVAPTLQPEDDVLLLKNKGVTYPVKFPAYSIGDGKLEVRDLRERAAAVMDLPSPRKVKLLYKGHTLKDDFAPCRNYNLKNESEVLCIIESSHDGSGSEGSGSVRSSDSNGKRSRKRKGKSRDPRLEPIAQNDTYPSLARTTSPTQVPAQTPNQPPGPPPQNANTVMGKLHNIETKFYYDIRPQCDLFLSGPPTDPKKKDFEHKKLSETIMGEVLLKLDAVETEGDTEAREKRRSLVKEAQKVLNELDKKAGH